MKYWHKRGSIEDGEFVSDDGAYIIPLGDFMRTDSGRYDGVATQTNTSAIGIVIGRDCESAVIQFFG